MGKNSGEILKLSEEAEFVLFF